MNAIWKKNGQWFVCHAVDGDDCLGPFRDEAVAGGVLRVCEKAQAQEQEIARLKRLLDRAAIFFDLHGISMKDE